MAEAKKPTKATTPGKSEKRGTPNTAPAPLPMPASTRSAIKSHIRCSATAP